MTSRTQQALRDLDQLLAEAGWPAQDGNATSLSRLIPARKPIVGQLAVPLFAVLGSALLAVAGVLCAQGAAKRATAVGLAANAQLQDEIARLRSESPANAALAAAQEQNTKLQEENQRLRAESPNKEAIAAADEEIKRLHAELQRMRAESPSKDALAAAEERNKKLQDEIQALRADLPNKEALAAAQGTIKGLQSEVQRLRTEAPTKEALAAAEERNKKLQDEIQALRLDLPNKEALAAAQDTIKGLQSEVQRLRTEAPTKEALAAADERNNKLQIEVQRAKDAAQKLQADADKRLDALKADIARNSQSLAAAQARNEQLQIEIRALKTQGPGKDVLAELQRLKSDLQKTDAARRQSEAQATALQTALVKLNDTALLRRYDGQSPSSGFSRVSPTRPGELTMQSCVDEFARVWNSHCAEMRNAGARVQDAKNVKSNKPEPAPRSPRER